MQPLTPSTLRHPLPERVMAARHKISILEQRALSAGDSGGSAVASGFSAAFTAAAVVALATALVGSTIVRR